MRRHGSALAPNRPNVVRNEYLVLGGDTQLIITRRDGSRHTAWIDTADVSDVQPYQWHLSDGYVSTTIGSKGRHREAVKLHRLLLNLTDGEDLGDHIDGDPLNNRRSNLRVADKTLNNANRAIVSNRGRSRYRGVQWRGEVPHWRAKFSRTHIGYFATEEQAAAAVADFRSRNDLPSGY
jgi:hypothetical protein